MPQLICLRCKGNFWPNIRGISIDLDIDTNRNDIVVRQTVGEADDITDQCISVHQGVAIRWTLTAESVGSDWCTIEDTIGFVILSIDNVSASRRVVERRWTLNTEEIVDLRLKIGLCSVGGHEIDIISQLAIQGECYFRTRSKTRSDFSDVRLVHWIGDACQQRHITHFGGERDHVECAGGWDWHGRWIDRW